MIGWTPPIRKAKPRPRSAMEMAVVRRDAKSVTDCSSGFGKEINNVLLLIQMHYLLER